MKTQIIDLPTPKKLLIIQDDYEQFEKDLDRCWSLVKDSIELKGFTKGKVPRSVAEKKISVEKLYKPVIDQLVDQAVKQEQLHICEILEVAIEWPTDRTKVAIVHVKYYEYPRVLSCDYKALTTTFKKVLVSEAEIETTLNRLAVSEAEEIPVEDPSSLTEEDKAIIEVDLVMDDVKKQEMIGVQNDIRIITGQKVWGFEQELLKYHQGDTFTYTTTLDENFMRPELAGRKVSYQVKVKRIYRKQLPELDDQLAQKIGFSSFNEMRESVKSDLEQEKLRVNDMLFRDHVMELLILNTEFTPIPDSLIKRELDILLQGAVEQQTKQTGAPVTKESFLQQHGVTEEQWNSSNWGLAVRKLYGNLALDYIAKTEGIVVEDDECEQFFKKQMPEGVELQYENVDREKLRDYLVLKKAQDLVIKNAEESKEESQDGRR